MKDNEIWEIINEQNELEHCPGVMSGESSEAERAECKMLGPEKPALGGRNLELRGAGAGFQSVPRRPFLVHSLISERSCPRSSKSL